MNFRDKWATNSNGEQFLFTVEMQRALHNQGLSLDPTLLPQLSGQPKSKPGSDMPKSVTRDIRPIPKPAQVLEEVLVKKVEEDEDLPAIQIDPITGKYLGRLKWYNASRGFGFIARGGGEQIFFHKNNALVDPITIAEGAWVLYDVEETGKGLEASEVELYQV